MDPQHTNSPRQPGVYECVDELCARLGISRRTFDRWKGAGKGPVITRIGHKIRISSEDSAAWLAAHREVPGEGKRAA